MKEKLTVSFNINFLKESAISLAKIHKASAASNNLKPIKPILEESNQILTDTYRTLSKIVKSEKEISPASEWLMDNFYIIQEQIVQIGIDFPKAYQKNIPILAIGEHKGFPRVYEIVLNMLTHTDNVLDNEVLLEYIRSYQQEETLQLGELWAIPIMIRLFLIQILAEKASRILEQKYIKSEVEKFVKEIEKENLEEPGAFSHAISGWAKVHSEKSGLLHLLELFNQLQSAGMLHEEQKRWFNYHINQYETTLEDAMRREAQKQSRLQVNIQNAVISLREITETEWSDFVEDCSVIDDILKQDPSGHYSMMSFHTRDSYRRIVEKVSRHSKFSETAVSNIALELSKEQFVNAAENADNSIFDKNKVKQHIGYFLIGDGYTELIKKTGYTAPLRERIHRAFESHFSLYLITLFFFTIGFLGALWLATGAISYSLTAMIAVILIAFFPALDLSITVVNRFFAFFLPPRVLPKMDYKDRIPKYSRTLVVVPTMLSSPEDALRQIENIEIHSLANPDPGLQFAILSDFGDATEKQLESDDAIIKTAQNLIKELNEKYSSRYGDRFFMLHRERLWNKSENAWMGWERKRGKLEELNNLICDPTSETSYRFIAGDFLTSVSTDPVQFVITLDADTKLPPGAAKKLISTIAHPLNRAIYDDDKKRITKGYSIIQPRISFSPESAKKTWFSKIFSGNVGIDPYSAAVSDIYQDLTGEAIFTGKGIYDVRAFHCVLYNRFPENRILSHDLIESTYLRAGLATDIELFDDYPSTYVNFTKRNHRWTRGDWQIASWLFPIVPGQKGSNRNPINLLSKWKIFDNLRRSLNFLFLTIFFIAGLFWMPGSGWIWVLAAFGILAFPTYVSLSSDLLNRPARVRWKLHMVKVRDNLKINTVQAISTVIILPHQAFIQLDAVCRTLYRLIISKKWLLEWSTASQTEQISPNSLSAYLRMMLLPVLLGVSIFIIAIVKVPVYLWIVTPFFLLWSGSPLYVWFISQPLKKRPVIVSAEDRLKLRMYARRTWFYFERFVNEEHFWLPPDNYQEDPPLPTVERTSPTNIGLALVSNQTAYNMGYITIGVLLERQQRSLNAILSLDKYHGHLFNWYETRLGQVLNPKYISTVDSGNLAASLIVIKEAVKQVMSTKGINKKFISGLQDTLLTIKDIFSKYNNEDVLLEPSFNQIYHFTNLMLNKLDTADKQTNFVNLDLLKALKEDAVNLSATSLLPLSSILDDRMMENLLFWIESPLKHIEKAIDEYKCMSLPDNLDIHDYSPDELSVLFKDNYSEHTCYQLIEKWQSQADEIVFLAEKMIDEMDFSFLYQKKRGLFSIGYNLDIAQYDKSTYDLLASEARIASYIAISKGDVPVEHWFRLSRRLTSINREEILLSWGGTMFEYLMPLLFLKSYPDTLMSHTYQNVINWQKKYGDNRGLPWGYSESAYYFLNIELHYQYRTFGVPGLGLKRGLADEYVVAPYASMLALMVESKNSIQNLLEIEKAGGLGLLGFYDAIDYTPSHLNAEVPFKIVKTYMVHHHGMGLIAIENFLNNWSISTNFHTDPRVKSCELLLQERIPRGAPIKEPHPIDAELEPGEKSSTQNIAEHSGMNELDASPPRLHTLSNGSFSAMITHAGTGYSNSKGIVINAWKPDSTIDPLGLFFYIKDMESNKYWSAMHQPVKRKPDRYDSWFHNGKVVCSRVDEWIETTTEICVSPDHQIELRKLTFTNYSDRKRILEVTSYAEVVLNTLADHNSHPAFSKLFIETEYLESHNSIIAKRRSRSKEEKPIWMIHTFAFNHHNVAEPLYFETERSNFIGKGRSLSNPEAMDNGNKLKGFQGNVSDPIVSFRKKITLNPGEKINLTFGLGFADSREAAIQMADMYDNQLAVNRAFDLASIYGSVELSHLAIKSGQAHYFHKLASYVFYAESNYRSEEYHLLINNKKQKDLWAYGISGDSPLVIFRINETNQLKQVKLLLKAHTFWRMRGIESELLIINEHAPGYIDEIQESIQVAIESSLEREVLNKRGGIFLYRADKIQPEDLTLLFSVAHAIFDKKLPDLSKLNQKTETSSWYAGGEKAVYSPLIEKEINVDEEWNEKKDELQFFNGYGGFSADGSEYHILIKSDPETGFPILPPVPWINVIANVKFGFTVSERGAGYTWSENSRENKLTSWSNDPVTDKHSEAFYIRDEEKMKYWSPAPGPVIGSGFYHVTHGFGFTQFEHTSNKLEQKLIQFVPEKEAVKISKLTLKNNGSEPQKLSVFRYIERVLGVERTTSSRFVNQAISIDGKTLYAKNNYNNEFAGRIVFSSVINPIENAEFRYATDRKGFIGRNRSLNKPLALANEKLLDNKVIIGGDPCSAMQTIFELAPGESVTLIFLEGESKNKKEAELIIQKYADTSQADRELDNIRTFWKKSLSKIRVFTPDKSLDVMVNGWLMYQNLSSRMWARTAFYQSGGAYGFRDQLQDATAALYVDPKLCRNQILLHAAKQFKEGDVLHWWHPPTGRGIRSKITDDRLWLPYVVEFYLQSTGDESILHENVTYISSRKLEPFEHEAYLHPITLQDKGTIYEHCCKAIDISLKFGKHGLPLIGGGDWNDGMNRVGENGKGESVWLGFFIYSILIRFEKVCRIMNDESMADEYLSVAAELKQSLNKKGWDGKWYLRAFYDDGTPLGSSENDECRIDAISQAWSVFSGVASEERSIQVLSAVEEHLVSEKDKVIRLLTPPFDKTEKDPGYIKGYIPGVRENGGQYTHAALWTVKAFAETGMGEKAVQYLNMVNPVNHALDQASADQYKVEPFVVSADVYGEKPLTGQGGWSWYTGSAGWMYRVALESVLGLRLNGDSILLKPSISESWPGYSIDLVLDDDTTTYHIQIDNPDGLQSGLLEGTVDGENVQFKDSTAMIPVKKDQLKHEVLLRIVKGV
ncbi:MAG: glycosyltransferase 36 [Chitinophagaceae bacterium]|nr:MAG: glycosyltransferase 36 [Chitinophagaceae bacterium]